MLSGDSQGALRDSSQEDSQQGPQQGSRLQAHGFRSEARGARTKACGFLLVPLPRPGLQTKVKASPRQPYTWQLHFEHWP